jgi:hypothetical protein
MDLDPVAGDGPGQPCLRHDAGKDYRLSGRGGFFLGFATPKQ